MLGLRRRSVRLTPHDRRWAERFREVAAQLGEATGLPAARIQHVGSTAVPDLAAKPILDIDVGVVESEDVEEVASGIVRVGFIDRGDGTGGIGRLLVRESEPDVRTIHVHVIPYESVWWRCDLAFRDALRTDVGLREGYGKLKAKLAERFPSDRASYREGKTLFIQRALFRLDPTGWRQHPARGGSSSAGDIGGGR